MNEQTTTPEQEQPAPKTNKHLRTWSGLCFIAALVLIFGQAFGFANPDQWSVTTLLISGLSGLGLVQVRNIAELYTKR